MISYDTVAYIDQMLTGSYIWYIPENIPVKVQGVAGSDKKPMVGLRPVYGGKPPFEIEWNSHVGDLIDFRCLGENLGLMNWTATKVPGWRSTISMVRRTRRHSSGGAQGLSGSSVSFTMPTVHPDTKSSEFFRQEGLRLLDNTRLFDYFISTPGFIDMYLNKYPTIQEASEILSRESLGFSVAFSRKFQLVKEPWLPGYKVKRWNAAVGMYSRGEVQLGPETEWAREELEDIIGVTLRAA